MNTGFTRGRGDHLKLNLGCGKVYKPGYVNVDSADTSVADENWDITDLPLRDSSVDLIEADQVIEHFDWVNVRYLLSECRRVLRKGGRLVIETPDLMGTCKRLKKAQGEEFLVGSQWLFGIDTKGQRHGMVFKEKELMGMLIVSGFDDVEFSTPATYTTEPGLRVECVKKVEEGRRKVESLFRKKVRKVFKGDSYILIPVEDIMEHLYFSLTVDGEPREPIFTENFFKAALTDPEIPGQFLLAMKAYRKGLSMADELMDVLKFIHDEQIKCRSFTLWMKRKKGADPRASFNRFADDLSGKLRSNLLTGESPRLELQYLLSLEPTHIRLMEIRLISDKAREWLNQGIKSFHRGDLELARGLFASSYSAFPGPVAMWNLARISYISGNRSDALKKMDTTSKLLGRRDLMKEAKREQEMMRRNSLEDVGPRPEIPI